MTPTLRKIFSNRYILNSKQSNMRQMMQILNCRFKHVYAFIFQVAEAHF